MSLQVTDATFASEVLNSQIPVLVDFWAPWCGPCRAMGPVLDELSKDYEGKIKICKMNVDENTVTPAQYGVRSIPTMVLIKNGQIAEQIIGAVPKESLKKVLDTKGLA